MAKKINLRGQMTIWIILMIVIVASVSIIFVIKKEPIINAGKPFSPKGYLDKCVRDNIQEIIGEIAPRGGFVSNRLNVFYNNINISYLCYNSGNYLPCINQHPMLISEIENEIKKQVEPKINSCIETLKREVIRKGGKSNSGVIELKIALAPERIFVYLNGEIVIKFGESISIFEKFETEVMSPIYDLAKVAMEIASQEARYCYFAYDGYMIIHPEYDIRKNVLSNSNIVYSIKDKRSGEVFNMGIRGCAIPVGL